MHELGFRIYPLPEDDDDEDEDEDEDEDDIAAAIDRTMTEDWQFECRFCSPPGQADEDKPIIRETKQIVAAPEYLLIHNNMQNADETKNRNHMEINEEIDLTRYMTYGNEPNPVPVRYGLRHLVYHAGGKLDGGHYVSAVTGLPPLPFRTTGEAVNEFFCDDDRIHDFTNALMPRSGDVDNVLTVNPVDLSAKKVFRTKFDFSLAWYVRLPNRREPTRRRKARTHTPEDEDKEEEEEEEDQPATIGGRVRRRKMVEREEDN
jgi:hypothetical protein